MVGKELHVAFIECEPSKKVLTLSEKVASSYKVLRELRPGSLVLGTVKKVGPHMAHIRLDGVRSSLLARLHVSKFSCAYTRSLEVRRRWHANAACAWMRTGDGQWLVGRLLYHDVHAGRACGASCSRQRAWTHAPAAAKPASGSAPAPRAACLA